VKKELADLLMEQLAETRDPRSLGEWKEIDRVPYLGHGPRHPSYQGN
jgi:hypothetical protein